MCKCQSVERAWAQRFISLSHNICPLLAPLITPVIAQRYGWSAVCYFYAGFGGSFLSLWRLFASNRPKGVGASTSPSTPAKKDDKQASPYASSASSTQPLFDWRILRTPPALALGIAHLASDIGDFTRHQLGPTIYMEKFGCSPTEMGAWLAIGNAMNIPAGFLWATLESVLIKRQVKSLHVRKFFECTSSFVEAAMFLLYGFAPNPLVATIGYSTISFFDAMHTSGIWSNYMEVGADDTAVCPFKSHDNA